MNPRRIRCKVCKRLKPRSPLKVARDHVCPLCIRDALDSVRDAVDADIRRAITGRSPAVTPDHLDDCRTPMKKE